MIVIDTLCYRSRLRYVNAAEKVAFSILTLIFCVVSRSCIVAVLALITNGFLTVGKGKLSFSRYGKLMMVPVVFLLLSTAAIVVNLSRTPMDAFAFSVGAWYLTGSYEGLRFGLRLILTAWASVSCLYFLSLNTTVTDILSVLRKLHCPDILTELMLLIYRFLFIVLHTASEIRAAQDARLGNRDFRTSVQSFGKMGTALLIQSLKKSNALYDAMESRCYDGKIRVLTEEYPARAKEITGIVLFELLLLALTVWRIGK